MSVLNAVNYIFRSRHFGQNQCQRLTKCSFKGHFHTLPEQDVSVSRHDVQNIKKKSFCLADVYMSERDYDHHQQHKSAASKVLTPTTRG